MRWDAKICGLSSYIVQHPALQVVVIESSTILTSHRPEVTEMLTVYSFSVQREPKLYCGMTSCHWYSFCSIKSYMCSIVLVYGEAEEKGGEGRGAIPYMSCSVLHTNIQCTRNKERSLTWLLHVTYSAGMAGKHTLVLGCVLNLQTGRPAY